MCNLVNRQDGVGVVGSLAIFLIVCHAFRLLLVRAVDVLISSHLLLLLLSALPLHRKKRWRGPTTVSTLTGRWYVPSNRHTGPQVGWCPLQSTSRCPTSTGAVHKSVTFSCVFMLVQLNKCVVVCGSDQGIVVMGVCLRRFCLSMSVV